MCLLLQTALQSCLPKGLQDLPVLPAPILLLSVCHLQGIHTGREVLLLPSLPGQEVPHHLPYRTCWGIRWCKVRLPVLKEGCALLSAASVRPLLLLRGSLRPSVLLLWSCSLHSLRVPGSLRVRSVCSVSHTLRALSRLWFLFLFLPVPCRSGQMLPSLQVRISDEVSLLLLL